MSLVSGKKIRKEALDAGPKDLDHESEAHKCGEQ
jgi:hypothetical protein